ncbi:response regulator transcription factor [Amycolatopsis saalfeldensis]|uniref:DNA-binding response regulator, NarL/FixJ family, contains REC and HTH domains n=1 Tax=Amycolatopsis saalfeldensis TaxID=394193 RepID=A0A1H8YIX4_9PSEU|nr:response regulator transcription factor [Amycolatopsis saalfeldensis]SEP52106.1 DNA-binding response regulator, NarL/FixJ family, contains REC and HTH domains [Amycolatopsis saalfeldensis]
MRGIEPHRPTAMPGQPGASRSLGVAVVDPVPIFREGLAAMVHRSPGLHWAGQAASHHSALQLCEQVRPDVVILDSALDPNCHLTKLLASGDPALLLVVLVRDANRTQQYLATAIGAGAHAIVPRSVDPRRLAEAIRRAHSDRRYIDPTLAALTARPKRQPSPRAAPAADHLAQPKGAMPLSRREYQVLQLVAEGLENSAIAKLLFLSVETVRTHVKSILRKLSARDRTHAVTIAFRSGILIPRADDEHNPAAAQPAVARGTP